VRFLVKARLRWPSGNGIFAILMVGSAVLMVLPSRWTNPVKTVRQILVPFQDGLYSLTASPGRSIPSRSTRSAIPAEKHDETLRELEAMRNEVISLQLQLREIEAEQPGIGTYLKKFIDRAAVREGRLIPARVVAFDPTGWRDAVLLGTGRQRGVRQDAWIASRRLLDAGTKDGVEQGMVVLAREYLIGRVEEVTPFSARVLLLSDVDFRAEVWIGRVEATRFNVLPPPEILRTGQRWAQTGQEAVFVLAGRGKGEMIVRDVHEDYVKHDVLRVGDLVVSPGTGPDLPVVMVIGQVEKIEDDPAQRQLRQLIVRCPVDTRALHWVYVVDVRPTGR
jgi:cell shape-determining protein MreC